MYEVELKCRADHDALQSRLSAAGATRQKTLQQRDVYYDAPHRDFAETDEALRLRREQTVGQTGESGAELVDSTPEPVSDSTPGPASKLTYKGPLVEAASKTRTEHETVVASGDETRAIVERLGFEPAAVVEKTRAFFDFEGYTVALDSVTGLGEFVEIETTVERGDEIPAARNRALELLETLDVDPETTIRTSYLGLLFEAGAATDGLSNDHE